MGVRGRGYTHHTSTTFWQDAQHEHVADKPVGGKSSEQVTDNAEITVDDVKNHAETPASDFEYVDHGDSVSIKAYNGSDPIVVIPEQIDGKDVIR